MSEKMGNEELLECLNTICDRAVSADEQLQDMASQAYARLVEIVEEHYSESEQIRGRLDRKGSPIYEDDRVLAIPYEHYSKRKEIGEVFWMEEYSGWGVKIQDLPQGYHSYQFQQLQEIEVLERKRADSEPDSDTQEELLATWEQLYDFFDEHHNLYTNDIGKRLREKCIRIKQLLQQKPRKRDVTREEVRKFCERGDELEQIQNELIEWFEKLGVMEEE